MATTISALPTGAVLCSTDESYTAFQRSSNNSTWATVPSSKAVTGGIIDLRPQYGTQSVALGGTIYYRLALTAGGYSSTLSVVPAVDSGEVIDELCDLVADAYTARGGAAIPSAAGAEMYVGNCLMASAYAYWRTRDAAHLTNTQTQFDYIETLVDADGFIHLLTYSPEVYTDHHLRTLWHIILSARLLRAAGQSTLAAEYIAFADTAAQKVRDLLPTYSYTVGTTTRDAHAICYQKSGGTYSRVLGAFTTSASDFVLNMMAEQATVFCMLSNESGTGFAAGGSYGTSALSLAAGIMEFCRACQTVSGALPYSTVAFTNYTTDYARYTTQHLAWVRREMGAAWNADLDTMLAAVLDWIDANYVTEPTLSAYVPNTHTAYANELHFDDLAYAVLGRTDPLATLGYSSALFDASTYEWGYYSQSGVISPFDLDGVGRALTGVIDTTVDGLLIADADADHIDLAWSGTGPFLIERRVV